MAVHSFRTPQEGIEQIQKAIDLMSLVHEIAHSTTIGSTIDELSQRIAATQEMSAAKQKALMDAEEIIAQSKEVLEEIQEKKQAHYNQVQTSKSELEASRKSLENEKNILANEKMRQQETMKIHNTQIEQSLVKVKKFKDEGEAKYEKAENLERDLANKQATHEEKVHEFDIWQKHVETEYNEKLKIHQENVQTLAQEKLAFELRKKKFEDALKG